MATGAVHICRTTILEAGTDEKERLTKAGISRIICKY
jgi:hypothetical protein